MWEVIKLIFWATVLYVAWVLFFGAVGIGLAILSFVWEAIVIVFPFLVIFFTVYGLYFVFSGKAKTTWLQTRVQMAEERRREDQSQRDKEAMIRRDNKLRAAKQQLKRQREDKTIAAYERRKGIKNDK